MPEPGDVVVAINNESLPFTITYNKRDYPLRPGQTTFVPFEAACLALGDPRAQENIRSYKGIDGLVAFIPDRATEVRRLRAKYGAVYGPETTLEGYFDNGKNQVGDPIHIPDITITTPDGEKMWMVVEDPAGAHSEDATISVSDNEGMLAQLKRQQAQIDLLVSQITSDNPNTKLGTVSEEGDVVPPSDDSDNPVKVK
jgi:hypothetical protein